METKTLKVFSRLLYGSHLLTSPLPKKLTWLNSEPGGKEIDPACLLKEMKLSTHMAKEVGYRERNRSY